MQTINNQTVNPQTIDTQFELNKQKRICPCCGQRSLDHIPQIDSDTVDYYIACMMTGQPFTKDYKLYNGRLNIKVASISDQLITKAVQVTAVLNRSNLDQKVQQALIFITYRLIPIKQICIFSGGQKTIFTPQATVIKSIDKLLAYQDNLDDAAKVYCQQVINPKACSTVPVKILDKVVGYHTQLMQALVEHGLDQSFCDSIQHA